MKRRSLLQRRGSARKLVAFVLVIAMAACCFSGCTKSSTSSSKGSINVAEGVNYVTFTDEEVWANMNASPDYYVDNALETEWPEEDSLLLDEAGNPLTEFGGMPVAEKAKSVREGVVIKGLADTAVQDKINKTIEDAVLQEMAEEMPEFPGLSEAREAGANFAEDHIYLNYNSSFNNMLGLEICHSYRVVMPDENGEYVYDEEIDGYDNCEYYEKDKWLNIDLNTGELFDVNALFAEGYDYKAVINGYIGSKCTKVTVESDGIISYENENDVNENDIIEVIGDYKGVDDDCEIGIGYTGLTVCFGTSHDEFYQGEISYFPMQETVPYFMFGADIDLEKFYDPAVSIYEGEKFGGKSLFGKNRANINERTEETIELTTEGNEPASITVNTEFVADSAYPEELINEGRKLAEVSEDDFAVFKEQVAMGAVDLYSWYNTSAQLTRYGSYMSLSGDRYDTSHEYPKYFSGRVFDLDADAEIELKDIFAEGVDYKSLLQQCMLGEEFSLGDYSEEEQNAVKAQLLENIVGFGLLTGLVVYFDTDGIAAPEGMAVPSEFYFEYDMLGCDNLVIFK